MAVIWGSEQIQILSSEAGGHAEQAARKQKTSGEWPDGIHSLLGTILVSVGKFDMFRLPQANSCRKGELAG
jgi:hypothetical protein